MKHVLQALSKKKKKNPQNYSQNDTMSTTEGHVHCLMYEILVALILNIIIIGAVLAFSFNIGNTATDIYTNTFSIIFNYC